MTERTAARLVWATFVCIVFAVVGNQIFSVATGSGVDPVEFVWLSFPLVGSLIASRQPRNAIGWVMLAPGVMAAVGAVLLTYSEYALAIRPGSLPRPDIALVLNSSLWVPFIGIVGTFLVLLFPDGRLPSPRWRGWAWFCGTAMALVWIAILLMPGPFDEAFPETTNPFGVEALRPFRGAFFVLLLTIPIAIVGSAVGLVQRFRRSRGQERLQLKWFAAAAALVAGVYLMLMALHVPFMIAGRPTPRWLDTLGEVGVLLFALIPVAAGVAILKYRLYGIDIIINRTLVYGALSAILAAAYFLGVALFQTLLPVEEESGIAVAASTLAIAALFRPLRARVQTFIDHRFYRSKYDAEKTIEQFSARLRDEVDLDELSDHLLDVVQTTMQPARVSLWLRPPPETSASRADMSPS